MPTRWRVTVFSSIHANRTYMSMTVGNVVRQFELVKRDTWFCHPGFTSGRGIGVNVHTLGQLGISFASDHPFCIVIFVTPGHTEHTSYNTSILSPNEG